jgi:uncharacterized protein
MDIDKDEIARLTEEYCGVWGINHTRRLLQLMAIIGQDLVVDSEALWVATHLHDWGAYSPWAQKDVDHALRSSQVAGPFLMERGYPEEKIALVTEIIALHHAGGADRSPEAILLRDADILDFLGVVGILRDFSKNPKDMRKAYEVIRQRRAKLPGMLALPAAQTIAAERVKEMDALLAQFEAESFGCF